MGDAFFFNYIMDMGGTESFLYYLAKKYRDRDITIYYKQGDPQQLERLKRYVQIKRITGEPIKCEKAFFCYSLENIENVEAEEFIFVVHADYKAQNKKPPIHPKITRYIAVSQSAADSFKELTGIECEVCYNPVAVDKGKPLVLMSATRLSQEKGKAEMVRLARRLEAEGIKFIWFVFTNDINQINDNNIIYCPPRADVAQLMPRADWFVQLSSAEAFCYSVVEANLAGVPCITTDLKVFDELGIQEIKVDDADLIEKIKNPPKVKFKAPADRWGEILTERKSTYKPPKKTKTVTVKIISDYIDILTGRTEKRGTKMTVSAERAEQLKRAGVAQ